VTEEKENRVVEILLSSVPPQPLMFGKIVGLGAAGLTQVAIWIATALAVLPLLSERVPALSGLTVSPMLLVLAFAFFVLGYLAYGAIFAAIGAIAPGTREAQQYSASLASSPSFR
jgi:ABC-2 type transport system permease protein